MRSKVLGFVYTPNSFNFNCKNRGLPKIAKIARPPVVVADLDT